MKEISNQNLRKKSLKQIMLEVKLIIKCINRFKSNIKSKINNGNYFINYFSQKNKRTENFIYQNKIQNKNVLLCSKLSPNDKMYIVGDNSGRLYFNNLENNTQKSLKLNSIPITSIKFFTKKNFLFTNVNGNIHYFKNKNIEFFSKETKSINCTDFNIENKTFLTGGNDNNIRVYDLETKKLTSLLEKNGHSSRIFSIKIDNNNHNIFYSGGWDKNLFQWDLRTNKITNKIIGPMICGDSIDIRYNNLLIGSQNNDNYLKLYDLRIFKEFKNIKFMNDEFLFTNIFCCKFDKLKNNIAVGTSGENFLSFFDSNREYIEKWRINGFEKGIYTMDFGNNCNILCFGSSCGKILTLKYY